MNFRRIFTIFRKELRDMLRDRRTLIAMVGIPVVLYPLLFIFGTQAAVMQQDRLDRTASRVGVAPGTDPVVVGWLSETPKLHVFDNLGAAEDLYSGRVDALVSAQPDIGEPLSQERTVDVHISYDAAEPDSRQALDRVKQALTKQNERILNQRLDDHGLGRTFIHPLQVHHRNLAPPQKTTGALLGMVLPLLMVVMLGVGAFYPAIDLTAGEKERGTFETLLSTPTQTSEIVYGKFLAVFCLSLLAGLLNLGSLLATFALQLAQLDISRAAMQISLPPATVASILLVMLPLAFLISALMMTVAMFARTFKEAQNLMTPFFIAILLPAALAALPGAELNAMFRHVPIANAALLFKALMMGGGSVQDLVTVFLSTTAFALAAVAAAVWIFKREEMILAEERGIPFTLRRREFAPREAPTPGMALFLFAVVLLLIFYVGSYVQSRTVIPGLLFTEWVLILGTTLLFLTYTRVDLKRALNLRLPSAGAFVASVAIGLAWTLLVVELSYLQNRFLPAPPELAEQMEQLYKGRESGWALAALLFAASFSPAVCEEVLFRGAILSGFRSRWPGWLTVAAVAVLFGLLHLSVYRMPVTAASGLVLTYVVLRSGSIYTGMLIHLLTNGLALLATTQYQNTFEAYRFEERGEPLWLVLTAVAVFALGIAGFEASLRLGSRGDAKGSAQSVPAATGEQG